MSTRLSGTIGRIHGGTGSRDNLTIHPLLSSGSTSPTPTPDHNSNTRYVPYTPRRTIISTTLQSPLPPSGTTNKIHSNLITAAQGIGLDTASVGWAILEKLSSVGDTEEWSEIWTAITKSNASLLLPLDHSSGYEKITPDFVSDHLISDLSSGKDTPVITLSGLLGYLSSENLTFYSSLPQTKCSDIALSSTPPLLPLPPDSAYPSYAVQSHTATLPLQPKSPQRLSPIAQTAQHSRLTMPFVASLFGRPPNTPPTATAPLQPSHTSSSPEDPPTLISAFTISRPIHRHDVMRDVILAIHSNLASTLEIARVPPVLIERVKAFTAPLLPFVKAPAGKKKLQDIGASPSKRGSWAVNSDAWNEAPEELAEKVQDLYVDLERWVRVEIENQRRNEDQDQNDETSGEAKETRVKEILEAVEKTLCALFYDRLFLPCRSDDASHDEALSSHIDALNLLDLGLEHLDVDVGDAGSDIDDVVRECGETLSQLDVACKSPAEKAAVLVAAHKLIVDRLSCLPPIRLRNGDQQTQQQQNSKGAESTHRASDPIEAVVAPLVASPDVLAAHDSEPVPIPVKQQTTTIVSGDVLFPLLIFAVVKSNPAHLVSHLLFTQRYRIAAYASGEEGYCLINLMAVAKFLENVDLRAVGVGEGVGIVSTADLTPIPIVRTTLPQETPVGTPGSLRGRVEQGVDAIAGSANKVISGVVDSSFGVLRSFLPTAPAAATPASAAATTTTTTTTTTAAAATETGDARWNMGMLRRESGFSITSLVTGTGRERMREREREEGQRELVEVSSRPGSIRSIYATEEEGLEEGSECDPGDEGAGVGEEVEKDGSQEGDLDLDLEPAHDVRSIRSFETMLNETKKPTRKSLTARLSSVPGLARFSGSGTDVHKQALSSPMIRSSLLIPSLPHRMDSPASSRAPSPTSVRLPLPNKRFMECAEDDLRVSEVGELLREYRRLVDGLRAIGGFDE